MKVLVTGASGFLGSHIAEALAAEGHHVRALLRRTSSRVFLDGLDYEVAIGDVRDVASLPAAVEGVDAVVHAAALTKARSAAEFDGVNRVGTENLVRAVEEAAPDVKRFVYISSLAARGPGEDPPTEEPGRPAWPLTAYGRTKLAGEQAVLRSRVGSRAVLFRMPVIYGPRDPALLSFFRAVRMRVAPLLVGGRNRISIVYAEDAARAVAQALTAEADVAGKTYSPEDGRVYTWRELLEAVEQAVGVRALRIGAPRWSFTAAALASEAFGLIRRRAVPLTREKVREMAEDAWVCSAEPLRKDVGWAPRVQVPEGARLTAEWYRRNRWL